jgi:hypothetical protein
MTSSAVIWSGALQAAATFLTGGPHAARWGIDQPRDDGWPASEGQMARAAYRVVELAAHIVIELPDDPEAGLAEAKEAAKRWLERGGR